MIVSFIEGRIRLRHPILTDESVVQQIASAMQGYTGIHHISNNLRTGSLLVEYDPTIISQADLLAASQAFEAQFLCAEIDEPDQDIAQLEMDEEEARVVQRLQQVLDQLKKTFRNDSGILFIMLLSSVASGFFGLKKWHTTIATAFAVVALKHFTSRRLRG